MQRTTNQRKLTAAKFTAAKLKVSEAASRARVALTHLDICVRPGVFSVQWGTGNEALEGMYACEAEFGVVSSSTSEVEPTMFGLLGDSAYTELADAGRVVLREFDRSVASTLEALASEWVELTDVSVDATGTTFLFADGTRLLTNEVEASIVSLLDSLSLCFVIGHAERTEDGWELVFADQESTTAINVGVSELAVSRDSEFGVSED